MSYQLGKNITATVAYYDVMDFPLTSFEIWKHLLEHDRERKTLVGGASFHEVWDILHSEQLKEKVAQKNGLYFLPGRDALVESRIRRDKLSVRKLKRMHRLIGFLGWVPYLRMIGATGSLSMKHGDRGSDWDMFVVLRSGKIWIGRTILTLFLHAMGKRRHGKRISNRACLNYYVTDNHLEIATKDLYSAHEYRYLIPMLSFGVFQIFELKNRWIKEYKPNFSLTTLPSAWTHEVSPLMLRIRKGLEYFLDHFPLEGWLRSWQQKRIAQNPKTHLKGSLVEATDRALVFVPSPRGPKVFEQFKARLRS